MQNLLGKKSSKNDAYVAITIDSSVQGKTKTKSKLEWNEVFDVTVDKASEIEFSVYDKNDGLLAILFFRLADLQNELAEMNADSETIDVLQNVWEMEPAGQIRLALKFTETKIKKQTSKLRRNAGVKKRKHYFVNGHKFLAQHFYQIMRCAHCQEYLVGSVGFHCDSESKFCDYLTYDRSSLWILLS